MNTYSVSLLTRGLSWFIAEGKTKLSHVKSFPLSLCTTGMVPRKSQNPHLPVTAAEIINQVIEIYASLGLTSVHIHARRADESPAWEKSYFEEIIRGIRSQAPEIVICVTTSGREVVDFEKRSEVLEIDGPLKPDLASLTLSSLNFMKTASVNSPEMVSALLEKMLSKGISPEFEVFDLGMLNVLQHLVKKFNIEGMPIVNFIMGNYAGIQAQPAELGILLSRLPERTIWSCGGVGKAQLTANVLALASGGGVRIGLEDNLYSDENKTLATNFGLVRRIKDISWSMGLRIMKPEELRSKLKL